MLTPRRSAQLGLGGACLVLVSSVAVLIAGGSDAGREVPANAAFTTPAVASPLSSSHVAPSAQNDQSTLISAGMK
jgi:hypothetical protein